MRTSAQLAFGLALALLLPLSGCDAPSSDARVSWLQSTMVDDNRILLERAPDAVADKFRKMASRPYYYFRGNMRVFIDDTTRPGPGSVPTRFASGPASRVLLVGDPHPENLGTYRPAEGVLVFEYNDFDAAMYGPFHQDVRRLALGFAMALREAGLDFEALAPVVEAVGAGYVAEIAALDAGQPPIEVRPRAGFGVIVDDLFRRAKRDGDVQEALDEYTVVEGSARVMFHGDVERPVDGLITDRVTPLAPDEDRLVRGLLSGYPATLLGAEPAGFFAIKGISRRLGAGVSSYPLRRYYALIEGPTPALDDDRLLEIKEVLDPTRGPARHLSDRAFVGNGRRVVEAQRRLHVRPDCDPLLGWSEAEPLQVRIRERTKYQKGIDVERIVDRMAESRWTVQDVADLARVAGRLLARSHARATTLDGQPGLDPIVAALGDAASAFVGETTGFVEQYLPRTEADYAAFVQLLAEEGPWLGYRPASR